MSTRPVAAMTDAVARQIVREHNGNAGAIAVALADEVLARGGWKANTCKPLLRAYELAAAAADAPQSQPTTDHDWDHYPPATTCRRCGAGYLSSDADAFCPGPSPAVLPQPETEK